ncbi:helix-turn-helix transcriptional regulator [Hamadaea tsunoensis]|uniref:helix-turn-helix transcriptional regulator n=1 Tax=Hamadaea tsunoensis TaxID=53368 RepID=UPI00040E0D63|nr:WYL domain-containing protein [Hamadaea tsunoensis]
MKSERLIALLFTLQARRSATAAELAAVLEVSERTILRDVTALQAAGVPLWSEPGRGGGIRLLDGWRTRLDGLTAPEAAALFVSGVPTALADLGLGAAIVTAQSKLLATLPSGARERAAQLAERFHLDAPGWFHRAEPPTHLADIATAVWEQRRTKIAYRRGETVVDRVLDPLGLVLKAGVWYLVAGVDETTRSYRVARIVSAEITGEVFERPAGFDLAGFWTESSAAFDRTLWRERVRLRVSGRALVYLRHHTEIGAVEEALAHAGPPDAEGWIELDLPVESLHVAEHQLVALGDQIEVLDPPSLRAAIAAVGARMAARNA